MVECRHLPPQIRRIEIKDGGSAKPAWCQLMTIGAGYVDGKRQQLRRCYETQQEARRALAEVHGKLASGSYFQPTKLTLEQPYAQWLSSRHGIKRTSAAVNEYVSQPIRSELGEVLAQKLCRRRRTRQTLIRHGPSEGGE